MEPRNPPYTRHTIPAAALDFDLRILFLQRKGSPLGIDPLLLRSTGTSLSETKEFQCGTISAMKHKNVMDLF